MAGHRQPRAERSRQHSEGRWELIRTVNNLLGYFLLFSNSLSVALPDSELSQLGQKQLVWVRVLIPALTKMVQVFTTPQTGRGKGEGIWGSS